MDDLTFDLAASKLRILFQSRLTEIILMFNV